MTGRYWLDSAIWALILCGSGWVVGMLTRRWHRPPPRENGRGT